MKKWIAAILLIISVACSAVPCCMSDGCSDEELSSEGLNHENEEEGACSPFFSCTACSGFTQITKPVQLSLPIIQKQQHHSQAIVFYHSGYAASFWQPPRLS